MRIAVLDTNVNLSYGMLRNKKIHVVSNDNCNYQFTYHGASVCKQILDECPEAILDVYPVFENVEADPGHIIKALSDIVNSKEIYDIVNMSFGFDDSSYSREIEVVCDKLSKKGSILVAAHDNWGGMTYPACLGSVIGVDVSNRIKRTYDFVYLEGQCVNIVCSARQLVTYDSTGNYTLSCSTSIHTARITGIIAAEFYGKTRITKDEVNCFLRTRAGKYISYSQEMLPSIKRDFGRCIAFPNNKEIITLYKLSGHISGRIVGIYDFHLSSSIGKTITSYSSDNCQVMDIKSVCFDSFDTVIIGHLDRFDEGLIIRDLKKFLQRCKEERKSIYLFDDQLINMNLIDPNSGDVVIPQITNKHVPFSQIGKMWNVPVPVVSVVGTSPHQGKFSLQVQLKAKLELLDYRVGFISTEPSGFLFGAQYVFPYGYRSQVSCDFSRYQTIVNEMSYEIYKRNYELIIGGLQSGIVPVNNQNVEQDTFIQQSIMFGLNPDAVLICISYDDDLSLIQKAVNTCRSLYETDVIAILVYPEKKSLSQSEQIIFETVNMNDNSYLEWKDKVSTLSGVDVFDMNEMGINMATKRIIDYFTD